MRNVRFPVGCAWLACDAVEPLTEFDSFPGGWGAWVEDGPWGTDRGEGDGIQGSPGDWKLRGLRAAWGCGVVGHWPDPAKDLGCMWLRAVWRGWGASFAPVT